MIAYKFPLFRARAALPRLCHYGLYGLFALALSCGHASAEMRVVDLRSRDTAASYFITFAVLTPRSPEIDPSAVVVWGDPKAAAAGGAYETVGLICLGPRNAESGANNADTASNYFGRLPDALVQQLHFEQVASATANPRPFRNALTILVDEDAYKDAYEVFGGPREGTYFEDQIIRPGDAGAHGHGIGQIISYFAGIASRLGEIVPDSLHLSSTAGEDPEKAALDFSPEIYLRKMLATAVTQTAIPTTAGSWTGDAFGKWPNGNGDFVYLSGARYSGEMHRGRRRGRGTLQDLDGLTIDGYFDGDEPVAALIMFPNGDSYSGTLKDNRLQRGTYQWRNGVRYEGSFGVNEQMVDGSLRYTDGTLVGIAQGLPQPSGIASTPGPLPQVDRLVAYAMDFSQ